MSLTLHSKSLRFMLEQEPALTKSIIERNGFTEEDVRLLEVMFIEDYLTVDSNRVVTAALVLPMPVRLLAESIGITVKNPIDRDEITGRHVALARAVSKLPGARQRGR